MTDNGLAALAARLRAARRITILTGAGVSAASGVPTFRGPGGLWRHVRPEDLATPEAFDRDPLLVWEWYAWRRETIAACRPNAAHEVIARWSRSPAEAGHHEGGPADGGRDGAVAVITQNVDDLHVRAGTGGLVRLHGSIWELRCHVRTCGATWRDERVPLTELPPRCPSCGGLARPAVVWFGEPLSEADIDAALQACRCDVFMTIGTSALVYPAAGLVHEARRRGAYTAEVNAEPTPASAFVDVTIEGPAEQVLPRVDDLMRAPS
jgi:NAD-dependent deacetylase